MSFTTDATGSKPSLFEWYDQYFKSMEAKALLSYVAAKKHMMQEQGDTLEHDPRMDAPVATSTGYLEHAAPDHDLISEHETEKPHAPIVTTTSFPSIAQKVAVEEVAEIITLTSTWSKGLRESELEVGSAQSSPPPSDTRSLLA